MSEQETTLNEAEKKWSLSPINIGGALGTAGAAGIFDLAAHLGPNGVFFGVVAALIAARHGEDIVNGVRDRIPQPILDAMAERFGRRSGQPKDEQGIECQSVYPSLPQPSDIDTEPLRQIGQPSTLQYDDDELPTTGRNLSNDIFTLSQLLDSGFVPTINKIFVGRSLEDGKDIFVKASDLCHVALAGKTGGGKGNLMRLVMVQLCYIGAKVLLLNPHYMKWVVAEAGPEFDEDWTPFEGVNPRTNKPYLEVLPIDCRKVPPIEHYLTWAVGTLLEKRKDEGSEGGKVFKPFFIVIDEWPSVAKKIKDGPDHLGELLREGRKFGIFVIVASQDFQVKTIGMEGGSVRKCLLTCFYTGGDTTTAKELLYQDKASATIPENKIGKGTVMLRCTGTQNEAILAKVPFVDNAAVYRLLGQSTFKKQPAVREEPADTSQQSQATVRPAQSGGLTLDRILALYTAGKITDEQLVTLMNTLPTVSEEDEEPVAVPHSSMPSQRLDERQTVLGVPYLRPMPSIQAPPMEDMPMRPSETRMLPEVELEMERRPAATGRFTAGLSPDLLRVYNAYEQGKSHRDIARELSDAGQTISHPTVGKIIQRLKDKGAIDPNGRKVLAG